jgi:ribosomal protein L22
MMDRYLAKYEPNEKLKRPEPKLGGMSKHQSTIFKPEYEIPGYKEGMTPKELKALREEEGRRKKKLEAQREHELHALTLDPAPRARRRFERKMVIKDVSRQQRITKAIKLARTERQLIYRSQDLPTSTKKLTRIMHLIAGKSVEEALVQLRFSKKRIARDVLKGLQIARDEAIAERGMGLGPSSSPISRRRQNIHRSKLAQIAADEAKAKAEEAGMEEEQVLKSALDAKRKILLEKDASSDPYMADGSNIRAWPKKGLLVELKDGSKKRVHDPTEMYIDQAWVGKGDEFKSPEFRARGRINMLTHRSSSKSLFFPTDSIANSFKVSLYCSKKRRHGCVSRSRYRRSATIGSCGYRSQIARSPRKGSTVCGSVIRAQLAERSCIICIPSGSDQNSIRLHRGMYNISSMRTRKAVRGKLDSMMLSSRSVPMTCSPSTTLTCIATCYHVLLNSTTSRCSNSREKEDLQACPTLRANHGHITAFGSQHW